MFHFEDPEVNDSPFVNPRVQGVLNEAQNELQNEEIQLENVELNDRKRNFTPDQLKLFFRFKDEIDKYFGEDLRGKLIDNIYCRYLTGYDWNLEICFKHMRSMIKWAMKWNLWDLTLANFPEFHKSNVRSKSR